ncbi:MAG: hypothetical protein PHV02_07180 [Rhodocyclaceae bacterium]|nr:hypothetical protein [Rhodocyclaceae bacterium]
MSNIEKFTALLLASGAISIDHGPLLTEWDSTEVNGDPENEVFRASWTDGTCEYSEVLDEGGIADGWFDDNGRFVVENTEGEKTEIRFYETNRLVKPFAGHKAADRFMQELLASVETLDGISEQYGARTLADLMYLNMAIADASFIEALPGSGVLEVVNNLPSATQWREFIRFDLA